MTIGANGVDQTTTAQDLGFAWKSARTLTLAFVRSAGTLSYIAVFCHVRDCSLPSRNIRPSAQRPDDRAKRSECELSELWVDASGQIPEDKRFIECLQIERSCDLVLRSGNLIVIPAKAGISRW